MKSVIRFILGGYRLCIYCNNPSFVSGTLMRKFHGKIYNVKVYEGYFTLSCYTDIKNNLVREVESQGHTVRENSVFGIIKKYRQIKSRPGLLLGVALAVMVIYLQTIPLWDIKVSGNKNIDEKEIISGLTNVGFAVGKAKNKDLLSDYENNLIMNDHRLSRVSINLSGNVAFVEVGERTEKNGSEIPSSMTGLYATRDSVIELPIVQSGESVVRKGDTVYSGQLLVSPVILGDNNAEYVVGAEGLVLGKTEDVFITVVPYSNVIASKTADKRTKYVYSFLGKEFSSSFDVPNFSDSYYKNINERMVLFNRFELPVNVLKIHNFEYKKSYSELSYDEAKQKAYQLTYERISEEKLNSEILSFDYSEKEYDDYFLLECRVECIENIASALFG